MCVSTPACERGDEIGVHYDPMIAKLICWDLDRPSALRRLRAALADYQVAGLTTNLVVPCGGHGASGVCAGGPRAGTCWTPVWIERYRAESAPGGSSCQRQNARRGGAVGS